MAAATDLADGPGLGAIRASVVAAADGAGPGGDAAYEMFDVETVDTGGARLVAPLLLEIGEEVVLRIARGAASADVRARVTGVERGERDAVAIVEFVDAAAAERVRAVLSA